MQGSTPDPGKAQEPRLLSLSSGRPAATEPREPQAWSPRREPERHSRRSPNEKPAYWASGNLENPEATKTQLSQNK